MSLELSHIHKSFGDFQALKDINLTVGPHDFVCLLGPSGCGKTTLLRIIAGLLQADGGDLKLDGQDLGQMPPRTRNFGIVFQSYSLFPNMTVRDNIAYGLRIRKEPADRIRQRVDELLQLIRIPTMAEHFPWQLSGGQQQRVALARALAVNPRLILLDEPLSALDARVRNEMRHEIRDVQRRLKIPTIMVTHDQEEALMLADTVVCMNNGTIEQVGSPQTLYREPKTRFVADFIGLSNLLSADWLRAHTPDILNQIPAPAQAPEALLCIRPEHIQVHADAAGPAVIQSITFLGNLCRMTLRWGDRELLAEQHAGTAQREGDRVRLSISPGQGCWVTA
ncbi:ABC transporter ATP-binding protein [Castellaniella sp.]|uniref:ABC transporter ATP-binding protein n=1 Tax=Castellaniella sp. TaxID=1955812 RepID=UPI002AFE628F|nr:ABC transporter ATP-binding protein [Castellaniella sp.]